MNNKINKSHNKFIHAKKQKSRKVLIRLYMQKNRNQDKALLVLGKAGLTFFPVWYLV
jgi:hypothetical protein